MSSNSKKKLQAKCTHHDGNYIEVEGRSEGGQKFYPAIKEEVGGGSWNEKWKYQQGKLNNQIHSFKWHQRVMDSMVFTCEGHHHQFTDEQQEVCHFVYHHNSVKIIVSHIIQSD